jgi:4-methyl-5(b-hydroxyethyl)-thiazole monophosphate biosynthesis
MKLYFFLANGFEETEAITPLDLCRRAGIECITVGIGGAQVTGAHGICVRADLSESEFDASDADGIILPGGMPGTLNLESSRVVTDAVLEVYNRGGLTAAICAAPKILGGLGLLNGRRATCYPSFETYLEDAEYIDERCVSDGNIITAKGAGAAVDFGLAIVKYFCGEEKAEGLATAFIANKG